jgi:hypothetical protein
MKNEIWWKVALIELFKRLTSRKLWVFLISSAVAWAMLERGVNHLYALSPIQSGVYGGMFAIVAGIVGALCSKYIGIEDVSYHATVNANASIATQIVHERIESIQELTERFSEEFKSEPSYRPLDTIPLETSRPDENELAN